MTAPPDDLRLYELFVLYWDNALNSEERAELEQRLMASAEAREWFQTFTMQAVAASELPAPPCPSREEVSENPSPQDAPLEPGSCIALPAAPIIQRDQKRRWTRRQALQYFGGGLATGIGGLALGRWLWHDRMNSGAQLWNPQGTVIIQDLHGRTVSGSVGIPASVPIGGTVSTYGLASSVVLVVGGGATITLTGDSAVRVIDQNRRLRLHRGAISAAVPPQPAGSDPLTVTTAQVAFTGLSGVMMTFGEHVRATEALVHQGTATATHPTGEPIVVVREGESLTVWQDGDHRKKPIPRTPDEYAWDLSKPFPDGWVIGQRDVTVEGWPIARTESWPDPYYQNTEMYQIRSNKQWLHGFFQVSPASVVRVRYRVQEPGEGQLCFCVRSAQSRSPQTGMLEWNGTFGDKGVNEWHWLEIKPEEMLGALNKHVPKFGAPWVGFLFIFNTYTKDLGLEIAELRVTRAGTA